MSLTPVTTNNSDSQNLGQINNMIRQLNNEQVTKTFKQPNGNAIITGKLPYEGGYGSLYYDSDNIPRIIIGILPDGTIGFVISKEGENVLDVFS